MGKVKRNDFCPCGSGERYKRCCGRRDDDTAQAAAASKIGDLEQTATENFSPLEQLFDELMGLANMMRHLQYDGDIPHRVKQAENIIKKLEIRFKANSTQELNNILTDIFRTDDNYDTDYLLEVKHTFILYFGEMYNQYGDVLSLDKKNNQANENFNHSLEITEYIFPLLTNNEVKRRALNLQTGNYLKIGRCFFQQGRYEQALENFVLGAKYSEEISNNFPGEHDFYLFYSNESNRAELYTNIAVIYDNLNKCDLAVKYFEMTLDVFYILQDATHKNKTVPFDEQDKDRFTLRKDEEKFKQFYRDRAGLISEIIGIEIFLNELMLARAYYKAGDEERSLKTIHEAISRHDINFFNKSGIISAMLLFFSKPYKEYFHFYQALGDCTKISLSYNDPYCPFIATTAIVCILKSLELSPDSAVFLDGEKFIHVMLTHLHQLRGFSEEETATLLELVEKFNNLRAELDPAVNPGAIYNQAVHFRKTDPGRAQQLALKDLEQQLGRPDGYAAEPMSLLLAILTDKEGNADRAWQFFSEIRPQIAWTRQPREAVRDIFSLLPHCLSSLARLEKFIEFCEQYIAILPSARENREVFRDMMRLMAATLILKHDDLALSSEEEGSYESLRSKCNKFFWQGIKEWQRLTGEAVSPLEKVVGLFKGAVAEDDPFWTEMDTEIENMDKVVAKKIHNNLHKQGGRNAYVKITSILGAVTDEFADHQDKEPAERLRLAFEVFRKKQQELRGSEDEIEAMISAALERLFTTCFLPVLQQIAHTGLPEELAACITDGKNQDVKWAVIGAKHFMDHFKETGREIDYSPAILMLCKTIEGQFKETFLEALKEARRNNGIKLDFTQKKFCLEPDIPAKEQWRTISGKFKNFFLKDEARFLFSDMQKTWQAVTVPETAASPIMAAIGNWFREQVTGTALARRESADALATLVRHRNNAAHYKSNQPVLPWQTADEVWRITMQALSADIHSGIIPEMVQAGFRLREQGYLPEFATSFRNYLM